MKNLKSVICHVGTLLTSILMIVFLSQAHVAINAKVQNLVNVSTSVGGFDLNVEGASTTFVAAYAFVIIAAIILSLLVVVSVLNLLVDFNVIKENKILAIANLVLSAIALLCVIVIFACVASEVASASNQIGANSPVKPAIGFGAILNLILGLVLAAFAAIPLVKSKK